MRWKLSRWKAIMAELYLATAMGAGFGAIAKAISERPIVSAPIGLAMFFLAFCLLERKLDYRGESG